MSSRMSKRCHSLLVKSQTSVLVKDGSDALTDVDYLKLFAKNIRAVALDGAGKTDFLVLGILDAQTGDTKALCCVKCLQVQAPNTALWEGKPLRITRSLARNILGTPKHRDYDGLVYDGFGVEDGMVVFTTEAAKMLSPLPTDVCITEAYLTAICLWMVISHTYSFYAASKQGGLHGWVEFADRYVRSVHSRDEMNAGEGHQSSSETSFQSEEKVRRSNASVKCMKELIRCIQVTCKCKNAPTVSATLDIYGGRR